MDKDARIYIAGEQTVIGAAILRELQSEGYSNVLNKFEHEPDFTDASQVDDFFARFSPEYVFLAAGKSGGISANKNFPADLMLDNLLVASHVIPLAYHHSVKKLLYLASSCTYPKLCSQPMKEEYMLTGPLEPTSEPYALAKIAGVALCSAYRRQNGSNFLSAIAADVFGPGDDFGSDNSHVLAALLSRMHQAKVTRNEEVLIWGTGSPRREFIYADDLANACIFVMNEYNGPETINLGSGADKTISELANAIKHVVGYQGSMYFDTTRPDGAPLKTLDSTKLRSMGWKPRYQFEEGLSYTYQWFLQSKYAGKG